MNKKHLFVAGFISAVAGTFSFVSCGSRGKISEISMEAGAIISPLLPLAQISPPKSSNTISDTIPETTKIPTLIPKKIVSPSLADSSATEKNITKVEPPSDVSEDLDESDPLLPAVIASYPVPVKEKEIYLEETLDSAFRSDISYLKISIPEYVDVYFSREKAMPQIIVCSEGKVHCYDWDYNLDYGDPIVCVKYDPHKLNGKRFDTVLSIALPTRESTESFSPIGAEEICGEEHLLSFDNLSAARLTDAELEIFPPDIEETNKIELGYRENQNEKNVFTLTLYDKENHIDEDVRYFEYPEISIAKRKKYTAVYDDEVHFTSNGIRYQRFGVSNERDILWLGKFCNSRFIPEKTIGYYTTSFGINLSGNSENGKYQPYPLEPEAWLDLDGDGELENVTYFMEMDEDSEEVRIIVTIDGTRYLMGEFLSSSTFTHYLFAVCLDGKTSQLMLLHYDDWISYYWEVYAYQKENLYLAGKLKNAGYGWTEEKKVPMFSCIERIHPLQNDVAKLWYVFEDGLIKKVSKEYYEFLEMWDGERNVLTVLQDVELYTEKNGKETFLLPKGSHAIILGGDLADWILIEDKDSGKTGWLKVKWYDNAWSGYWSDNCILPDGSIIPCEDLFEGLRNYG